MDDLLRLLAVLALVGANAFFVVGEYAVVTARRAGLTGRAEAGSARAQAALRLMDDPVRVISTVQVGITALGILTGALGEPLVREVIGDALPHWAAFVLSFGVVTFLSVVLGELVPKALTLDRAETLAMLVARPIEALSVLFRPAVWVLQGAAQLLLRPFGIREVVAGETIRSADELRQLVDEAEGSGVIPEEQETLLHNVLDFGERDVRDAIVPASEVAWLDADATVEEGLERMVAEPHSRYPVGRGSLDRLVGVVHVRELVAAARTSPARTIGDAASPAHVVPEGKPLRELLDELRARRLQLAVVVDEYGGVAGIVTLEDLIEQLVGEIEDEYDVAASPVEELDGGVLRVPGSLPVRELARAGVELPPTSARTTGGVVFEALGRRPELGDEVRLGGTRLAVEELDGVRIAAVRVVPAGADR
ncbi:hemolysin family protein [Conexibacter sp. SYSU D00693]|uniref:hemolysin family protein n=1 Tax=Conexibacter sp. SYSU D00693 TaxID=2812560 RepID=UPI00196A6382|nr:hemolysin family protein [Conexibacter sp. SYSU D00693]